MNLRLIFLCISLLSVSYLAKSQNPDVLKSDAIRFEWDQAYEKSAALYQQAAQLYEQKGTIDTLCFFKGGQNYVRAKQFSQAIPLLERSIVLNGERPEVWFYLAEALSGDGKYQKAQARLDEGCVKFQAEAAGFLQKKAELAYEVKNYDEVLSFVDKALEIGETNGLWTLKAHALERLGDNYKAAAIYRQLLEQNSEDQDLKLKLGFLIFKATDKDYKSEKTRYTKLSNPSRVDYSNSRKKLDEIAQGYKDAIPLLESVLKSKPNDSSVMKCLYISYSRLGNKVKEAELKQKLGL